MSRGANVDPRGLLEEGAELLQLEAFHLDEAAWDKWLDLYTDDCVFWVPAWRLDGTLVENPRREVSHIYSVGKGALRDRIYRVNSNMSISTVPLQRTTHILSSSKLRSAPDSEHLDIYTAWNSHVFFPRTKQVSSFFGHYEHHLVNINGIWKIRAKKVVIKNDHIPTMIDFFFI